MERDEGAEFFLRPLFVLQRKIELAQQLVDVVLHEVEQQLLLGADVVVKRARLDADFGCELAQAHGRVTVLEDQTHAGLADRFQRFRAV